MPEVLPGPTADQSRYRRGLAESPYRPLPARRARGGMGEGVRCPVCRRELIARVTPEGVRYPCSCKP